MMSGSTESIVAILSQPHKVQVTCLKIYQTGSTGLLIWPPLCYIKKSIETDVM